MLVKDIFLLITDHAKWQDIEVEHLGVPPDIVRGWMQRFLDAGLYQESKRRRGGTEGTTNDVAVFLMKNDMDVFGCRTMNPDLVGPARQLSEILSKHREYHK